jgi:hypothetical protein
LTFAGNKYFSETAKLEKDLNQTKRYHNLDEGIETVQRFVYDNTSNLQTEDVIKVAYLKALVNYFETEFDCKDPRTAYAAYLDKDATIKAIDLAGSYKYEDIEPFLEKVDKDVFFKIRYEIEPIYDSWVYQVNRGMLEQVEEDWTESWQKYNTKKDSASLNASK